eukprot:3519593-Prymnesium_polylepis.1
MFAHACVLRSVLSELTSRTEGCALTLYAHACLSSMYCERWRRALCSVVRLVRCRSGVTKPIGKGGSMANAGRRGEKLAYVEAKCGC